MPRAYNVRFASSTKYGQRQFSLLPLYHDHKGLMATSKGSQTNRQAQKSRSGCRGCKIRHLKCDETFPVCRSCQRLGIMCLSGSRPPRWRMEIPPLGVLLSPYPDLPKLSTEDQRLVEYWVTEASHVFVVDPTSNPMSYPILEQLPQSPALLHAMKAVSRSHQCHFEPQENNECLRDRAKSLVLLRGELHGTPSIGSLLAAYILGISTSWIDWTAEYIGDEHLYGVEAILELHLSANPRLNNSFINYLLGAYLYWRACCAHAIPSKNHRPVEDRPIIMEACKKLEAQYKDPHPVTGITLGLYVTLSKVSRYCRRVLDSKVPEPDVALALQQELFNWDCVNQSPGQFISIAWANRHAGLIMLYKTWSNTDQLTSEDPGSLDFQLAQTRKATIQELALNIMQLIREISLDSPFVTAQGTALLTAAVELTSDNVQDREEASRRFSAIFSLTRIPAFQQAKNLMEEVWKLKDKEPPAQSISWLEYAIYNNIQLIQG